MLGAGQSQHGLQSDVTSSVLGLSQSQRDSQTDHDLDDEDDLENRKLNLIGQIYFIATGK